MITTTISPTINPVAPAPKSPANSVTSIPQAKASYTSGEMLPMVGTPEYKKAQELANSSRVPATSVSKVPNGWDAETYANFKQANPNLEPDAEDTARMQNAGNTTSDLLGRQASNILGQSTDVSKSYENALNKMNTTLEGIRTGTVPLSPYEQAQLDATRNAMRAIIEQQKIENENYIGGVKVANEARGLSRYSPEMAQGEIFAATNEANAKLADLNNKMALNLAQMESGFRDNNFKKVQESFQYITAAKEEKTKELEGLYNTVVSKQQAIQKQQQDDILAEIEGTLLDDSYSLATKKKAISQMISTGALNPEQIKQVTASLKEATDLDKKNQEGFQDIIKSISLDKTLTAERKREGIKAVNNVMQSGGDVNQAYYAVSDYMSPIGITGNELLTIDEAKILGVPYGTTRNQAIKMNRVPGAVTNNIDPQTGLPVNSEVAKGNASDYQTISSAYTRLNGNVAGTGMTTKELVDLANTGSSGYRKAKGLLDKLQTSDIEGIARQAGRIQSPDVAKTGGDPIASLAQTSKIAWTTRMLLSQIGLMKQYDPDQVIQLLQTIESVKEEADKNLMPGSLGAENITIAPDNEVIEITD